MALGYSAVFAAVAVTAAQDFFEGQPADDKPAITHSCIIAQHSDAGDAQAEFLEVRIVRGFTSSGSGGSTATPRPLDRNNSVTAGMNAGSVEINNTTVANTGTTHTIAEDAWPVQGGWPYVPTPEQRTSVSQGDTTIVFRLPTAPADSLTTNGTWVFEEN